MQKVDIEALRRALENLEKNLKELDKFGEDLRELSYNPETCLHNRNAKEYIDGMKIFNCVAGLNIELKSFKADITSESFKKLSDAFNEELENLKKETYSETSPCELLGIIIQNLLIAVSVIGLLFFAGKAIYSAATEGRLNPHSIFYGTRKVHEQNIHDIQSDLKEIDKILRPSNTLVIN